MVLQFVPECRRALIKHLTSYTYFSQYILIMEILITKGDHTLGNILHTTISAVKMFHLKNIIGFIELQHCCLKVNM